MVVNIIRMRLLQCATQGSSNMEAAALMVEDIGKGNEACAACIREYKDALAAVVIRRWMRGDGAMEWLSLVADYVHCK